MPAMTADQGITAEKTVHYHADTTVAGRARRAVRLFLLANVAGVADDTVDTAMLLVSELATNAYEASAAGAPVDLRLEIGDKGLFIGFSDFAPGAPRRAEPGPQDEGGRGLVLVQELSSDFGTLPLCGGKCVYCTIPVQTA